MQDTCASPLALCVLTFRVLALSAGAQSGLRLAEARRKAHRRRDHGLPVPRPGQPLLQNQQKSVFAAKSKDSFHTVCTGLGLISERSVLSADAEMCTSIRAWGLYLRVCVCAYTHLHTRYGIAWVCHTRIYHPYASVTHTRSCTRPHVLRCAYAAPSCTSRWSKRSPSASPRCYGRLSQVLFLLPKSDTGNRLFSTV